MSSVLFVSPYRGYDVRTKRDSPSWDALTRRVVERRIRELPTRRFFDEHEWKTLEAICRRVMPQPERQAPIPIVAWIDEKVHLQVSDGTRFADQPPLQDAWRRALRGIDQECAARSGRPFVELNADEQDEVLRIVQRGAVRGDAWQGMSAKTFFASSLLSEIVGIYYAHPDAWSEIGFGGPASPRGYARLDANTLDPWEAQESRHEGGDR